LPPPPAQPGNARRIEALLRRMTECDRAEGLRSSISRVEKEIGAADQSEQITHAWAVTMMDDKTYTCDRFLVLTNRALYRVQWLPEYGFVQKCRRTPLGQVHRVYEDGGWVTLGTRVDRRGAWNTLISVVTKSEPAEARPWRQGGFVLKTRWFKPLDSSGEPAPLNKLLGALLNAAPRSRFLSTPQGSSEDESVSVSDESRRSTPRDNSYGYSASSPQSLSVGALTPRQIITPPTCAGFGAAGDMLLVPYYGELATDRAPSPMSEAPSSPSESRDASTDDFSDSRHSEASDQAEQERGSAAPMGR